MAPFKSETEASAGGGYVGDLRDYESSSSRVDGYRKINKFPDHAPKPLFIIGHENFQRYQEMGLLDDEAKTQLTEIFNDIRKEQPDKGVYIGRGFYVPGNKAPNGPRTASILDVNQFLDTVQFFYQNAIERGYNVPGADLALVVHPFINSTDERDDYGRMKIDSSESLPWSGGYIVPSPLPGEPNRVLIGATFGSDEATESEPYDRYFVDTDRRTVLSKQISTKSQTIVSRTGIQYEIVPIPHRYQNEQALTDEEVIFIAQEAQSVFSEYPNSRIEFMVNKGTLYFREIAPYTEQDTKDMIQLKPGEEVTSVVVRIRTAKDVERVIGPDVIVFFGPEAFQERSTDLFAQVSVKKGLERLICLVHGELETSHAARILLDNGHSVKLVGDEEFEDGVRLKIMRAVDNGVKIELLEPYAGAIIPFSKFKKLQRGEAGMKVARLAKMKEQGITVPDGFGIPSEIIWRYLADTKVESLIAQLDSIRLDNPQLDKLLLNIQRKIMSSSIPQPLQEQIQHAITSYGFEKWAVRSSGNEDGDKKSLAGLYASSVDVDSQGIEECIKKTVASYFSRGSVMATRSMGKHLLHMVAGVGIQEYIPSSYGMVIFTDAHEMRFEIKKGSPEGIVAGTATEALRVTLPRGKSLDHGKISRSGSSPLNIKNETLIDIAKVVGEIEGLFRAYQDIELLLTDKNQIVVVQARPL